MISFFKVNVLRLGIYANIYLDNNIIATKKYLPYGYQLKNDFDKPGYISNWKTTETSDSFLELSIVKSKFPNKINSFYLEYTKKNIKLKFFLDKHLYDETEGEFDDEINFPIVKTDKGYEFEGFYVDQMFNIKFDSSKYPTNDSILYIKVIEIRYPIYYQNLSEENNNLKNPKYITINQKISLLSPNVPGYDFLGWYDNPKFLRESIKLLTDVEYDVYLYPKLSIKTFSISFLEENDEILPKLVLKYNEKINIDHKLENKAGFTFGYWLYKGKKFDLKLMPAHNIVLEIKWIPIEYTVTLNLSYDGKIKQLTYNRLKDEVKLEFPIREGFSFLGWYLKPDYSGSKISMVRTITMKDILLYAKWEIKKHCVRLYNGNELYKEFFIQEGKTAPLDGIVLNKEGWVFNGWALNNSSIDFFDSRNLIYRDVDLYANFGKYRDITEKEYSIKELNDRLEIKFNIQNSCNMMKYEHLDFYIFIHALPRNINEEDFYFENSIETSNVWAADINLISSKSLNSHIVKQIKPVLLKNYNLEIDKKRLVYNFSGKIENVLNVFVKNGENLLFKKQINFYNTQGNVLNSIENTIKFAIESTFKYIIYIQLKYFGAILDSQQYLLNDFQSGKLELNEKININSLINSIHRSIDISLRDNNFSLMKKSLTVTLFINDIRDLLLKVLLLNEKFNDELIEELKIFSQNFSFDLDDSFSKLSSALKDSNIELSLGLFNIKKEDSKESKLSKINKKYLEFSKKIISSNKKISEKAKEIVTFLANERKKLEEY